MLLITISKGQNYTRIKLLAVAMEVSKFFWPGVTSAVNFMVVVSLGFCASIWAEDNPK